MLLTIIPAKRKIRKVGGLKISPTMKKILAGVLTIAGSAIINHYTTGKYQTLPESAYDTPDYNVNNDSLAYFGRGVYTPRAPRRRRRIRRI